MSSGLDVRDAIGATVDVVAAALSIGFLVGVPASLANTVLGAPVSRSLLQSAVAVVAVGGAYPFVAGDWSLSRLTDFAVVALVALLVVGGTAAVALSTVGGVETDSLASSALSVGATLVAYLAGTAYVLSRERRHDAARRGDGRWL